MRSGQWAVSGFHAKFLVDLVIDDKSEIDGVVEPGRRDLGVDEEQSMSRFVVLGRMTRNMIGTLINRKC